MAVGLPAKTTYVDGDVFSASDINDTNGTINITAAPFAAGKNKIINGDFGVWQRGTTFTNPVNGAFIADRWRSGFETSAPTSYQITRQTFTPGAEPVSGYNSQYFLRAVLTTVGTCTKIRIQQRIEDVGTFANETITVSFYAKSDSNRTQTVGVEQLFGSGGSSAVLVTEQTINTTTAWQRFSLQFAVPSISGKTIGTGSSMQVTINQNLTNGNTLDIWGVQAEISSVATAFQTATGTIQGELAACQRFYRRFNAGGSASYLGFGSAFSTTKITASFYTGTMRITPATLDYSGINVADGVTGYATTAASLVAATSTPDVANVDFTVASGLTQYRPYYSQASGTSSYVGFSAEL
jgi:hypothetical protein